MALADEMAEKVVSFRLVGEGSESRRKVMPRVKEEGWGLLVYGTTRLLDREGGPLRLGGGRRGG